MPDVHADQTPPPPIGRDVLDAETFTRFAGAEGRGLEPAPMTSKSDNPTTPAACCKSVNFTDLATPSTDAATPEKTANFADLERAIRDLTAKLDVLAGVVPEALTRREASTLIGVSVSHFGTMERSGELGPMAVHVGGERSVRYVRGELVEWLKAGAPHRIKWQAMRAAGSRRAG
jgi:predicted DNA-binding transcriptional regulator AlpA